MTHSDPQRSFRLFAAKVRYRIAKLTLPMTRSLCATVAGAIVGFLLRKRTWGGLPRLVAL